MLWSLHDNTILSYFLGHTDEITSIEVNPLKPLFISTARNSEVWLWDYNSKECQAVFNETECACFDNTGKVIALVNRQETDNSQKILLYSLVELKFDVPICTFDVLPDFPTISGMKFSNDGRVICLIGNDSKLLVIDAFDGVKKGYFDKVVNEGENPCFADFSIDSKYLLTAGEDKILYFWNWKTNECVQHQT